MVSSENPNSAAAVAKECRKVCTVTSLSPARAHKRASTRGRSLALVPTLEWLKLPPDLLGTVTARSTWAREGLSIATATLIEPGYQGIVTLELANLGQIPLALYPGLPIAQIAFALTDGNTVRPNRSQFDLSFEPTQGTILKPNDFSFIPDAKS
jgi:dCTP deaminase